jgi:hypothetical protein
VVDELLARRIVVDVPADHRVGRKRATRIRRDDFTDLAQRIFRHPFGFDPLTALLVEHDELGVGVVSGGPALERRLHRNRSDAAILVEAGRHDGPPPYVLPPGRERERFGT